MKPAGKPLERDSKETIPTGCYVLLSPEGGFVNVGLVLHHPLRRGFSYNVSTIHVAGYNSYLGRKQSTKFSARVRKRDKRCCLSGRPVVGDNYTGFEAMHFFPWVNPTK
ncbi:hypothetical protein M422DRAFT_265775 [Sphaerobolus stellatus SS14]|uniref:Unplaced genomic scaffold SPHSTscaffold_152, whole genome shotgun sequence n=1 Tax=Sphaerobolus stellatus (strain SS14) TaxID=990650 RepID=A0A0C9UCQ2_SPHS4|nr:hypothetical protein M422DRAFT_265775 [Sphaerobolus stellatus SS14]